LLTGGFCVQFAEVFLNVVHSLTRLLQTQLSWKAENSVAFLPQKLVAQLVFSLPLKVVGTIDLHDQAVEPEICDEKPNLGVGGVVDGDGCLPFKPDVST